MTVYRLESRRLVSLWSGWRRIIPLSRVDGAEALRSVGRIWIRLAGRDVANEIGFLLLVSRLLTGVIVEGRREDGVLVLLYRLGCGLLSFPGLGPTSFLFLGLFFHREVIHLIRNCFGLHVRGIDGSVVAGVVVRRG